MFARLSILAVDLSKQKELDADPRATQQIQTNSKVITVSEKSKETVLEFYKGTAKFCKEHIMVEYNTINAKLSNSQLNKLKNTAKNRQRTTLRMNARMLSANNLPHELLLTTRQTTKLRNAIENNMSTDIKLSKAQISKIIQSGGFLGKVLGPLLKTGLPLINNVIKPLAKSVLIPLGLTAAASAADAGIQKIYTWLWNNNFTNFK